MAVQVPPSLKAISPFLKTAQEYDKRDPVVAYYCKFNLKYFLDTKWYVVQKMFEKTATNDASYKNSGDISCKFSCIKAAAERLA